MNEELDFNPIPLFNTSFHQTVMGSFPSMYREPPSHTKFILLPDKDYLALEVTTPKKWKKTDPTVFLVHGLCGSHRSACLVRLAKKLRAKNIRAIRVNLRGCGSGRGKAKRIYHAGQSDDVFQALKSIAAETPDSEMILIGFSLGGNITLKLAAELSLANIRLLKKAIAINPPVDLYSSIKLLGQPHNRVYEKYFVKLLRQDLEYRRKIFPELQQFHFPEKSKILDFDNIYTAPEYGFKDNIDYYKRSSSKYLVPAIDFDCNILFSEDDPIIEIHTFENVVMPKNIHLYRTRRGGHIGYITMPTKKGKGFHWIDNVILDWVYEALHI